MGKSKTVKEMILHIFDYFNNNIKLIYHEKALRSFILIEEFYNKYGFLKLESSNQLKSIYREFKITGHKVIDEGYIEEHRYRRARLLHDPFSLKFDKKQTILMYLKNYDVKGTLSDAIDNIESNDDDELSAIYERLLRDKEQIMIDLKNLDEILLMCKPITKK